MSISEYQKVLRETLGRWTHQPSPCRLRFMGHEILCFVLLDYFPLIMGHGIPRQPSLFYTATKKQQQFCCYFCLIILYFLQIFIEFLYFCDIFSIFLWFFAFLFFNWLINHNCFFLSFACDIFSHRVCNCHTRNACAFMQSHDFDTNCVTSDF